MMKRARADGLNIKKKCLKQAPAQWRFPNAATLGVFSFNVNMTEYVEHIYSIEPESLIDKKVQDLALHIARWLNDSAEEPAVVGLNDISPSIAEVLEVRLFRKFKMVNVGRATLGTNTLLWCALPACPASCWCRLRCLPALPACPAWCWCLDAQRAVARLQNTHAMRATRAQQTHTRTHHMMFLGAGAVSSKRAKSSIPSTCPATRMSRSPGARTCGCL